MPIEKKGPWGVLAQRDVYDNRWIRVTHHDVTTPAGEPGIYGKIHYKNLAIGIVPVDAEMHTFLVGQYRFPLETYSWEIPEGGGAPGVDPLESAARELREETGLRAALILAQGSEFGFVLTSLAGIGGILSGGTILNLNAAIVLSIALTPALATLGRYAASYIRDRRGRRASSLADESEHLAEHVLVAGYGRVGQAICRLLDNAEIGYVVLDLNVQRVIRARARGLPVYFGDASRIDVLRAAGVERASLAVIAIDSPASAWQRRCMKSCPTSSSSPAPGMRATPSVWRISASTKRSPRISKSAWAWAVPCCGASAVLPPMSTDTSLPSAPNSRPMAAPNPTRRPSASRRIEGEVC